MKASSGVGELTKGSHESPGSLKVYDEACRKKNGGAEGNQATMFPPPCIFPI